MGMEVEWKGRRLDSPVLHFVYTLHFPGRLPYQSIDCRASIIRTKNLEKDILNVCLLIVCLLAS